MAGAYSTGLRGRVLGAVEAGAAPAAAAWRFAGGGSTADRWGRAAAEGRRRAGRGRGRGGAGGGGPAFRGGALAGVWVGRRGARGGAASGQADGWRPEAGHCRRRRGCAAAFGATEQSSDLGGVPGSLGGGDR